MTSGSPMEGKRPGRRCSPQLSLQAAFLAMTGVCVSLAGYRLGIETHEVAFAVLGVLSMIGSVGFLVGTLLIGTTKGGLYGAVVAIVCFVVLSVVYSMCFKMM